MRISQTKIGDTGYLGRRLYLLQASGKLDSFQHLEKVNGSCSPLGMILE